MKILSTVVTDHVANGDRAVNLKLKVSEMTPLFSELVASDKYILADDGLGNKVIIWNSPTAMLLTDAKAWLKRSDNTELKFSVLLFKSPEEQALEELGILQVRSGVVNNRTLYTQLIETYQALGIHNWVETGAPVGLRSILAYRYGYEMNPTFNTMLSHVMKEADEWLIYNLQQVTIESDLRMN